MTSPTDPDDLSRRRADLERRLAEREERQETSRSTPASRSDLARGLKLSSEFIAGVVVGALLGFLFDRLLGTSPFGLIVFLLLGFGAGILNVLRETGQVAQPEARMGGAGGNGTHAGETRTTPSKQADDERDE